MGMALEKIIEIDKIEILKDGQIQIRRSTKIIDDGIEMGTTYHRHVLLPGDPIGDQHERVISIANAIWTTDVVDNYRQKYKKIEYTHN
jgi:hypothetical protein